MIAIQERPMPEVEWITSRIKGQFISLRRDVTAILIPFGTTETLPAGSEVLVMQAKGSSVSVGLDGRMYFIEGRHLDALGLQPVPGPTLPEGADDEQVERFVWDQLRTCYDPEIPVNIVDLGLVYGCRVEPGADGYEVQIRMTLTSPGCGMGDVIAADARHKLLAAPPIRQVQVEIVFDPPWSRERMSETAQLELGMF
jgi:probable FeS assembly SUF system protein SufT